MKVLAVDPGYDRLGVAVIERVGTTEHLCFSTCIETDRNHTHAERLRDLGDRLATLLTEHAPDAVAVETLFFNQNRTTALGVAQARGVVLYLANRASCTVYEFGPQEVKVAVTGYGGSDKQSVYTMVQKLLPDIPTGARDDEYDAIAVGITCLAHHR